MGWLIFRISQYSMYVSAFWHICQEIKSTDIFTDKLILILIHVQALLYLVQCILSQRHQLISTIPTTVPLL